PDCFYGTPATDVQFASACTTAQCVGFDNCGRLGICQGSSLNPDLLSTPADLGAVPTPVNTETMPSMSCKDPSRPNLIYMTGSTNFPPLLKAVAPLLAANSPPYTVIFQPQTSCKGAASVFDADPTKHLIKDIVGNWAFFYTPDGTKNYCLLDTTGDQIDVGESDVYGQTCGYASQPGIADYTGPIQAITFVVPSGSSQRAISAEAAHLTFGTGGAVGPRSPVGRQPARLDGGHRPDVGGEGHRRPVVRFRRSRARQPARAGVSRDRSIVRLFARLVLHVIRQSQRARRPLSHLGSHPLIRAQQQQCAFRGGGRAGHPLCRAAPRSVAARRDHRVRLHPAVRDAGAARAGDGRADLLSTAVWLRLLFREQGERQIDLHRLRRSRRLPVDDAGLQLRLLRGAMTAV